VTRSSRTGQGYFAARRSCRSSGPLPRATAVPGRIPTGCTASASHPANRWFFAGNYRQSDRRADRPGPRNTQRPRLTLQDVQASVGSLGAGASASWRPADEVLGQQRPAASQHRGPLVLIIQRPPAIPRRHSGTTGAGVLPEPGLPAGPILSAPFSPVTVQRDRAGGLGDVVQDGGPASPAASAALGRVQRQVPSSELHHRRAGDHRGLAEGQKHQADGDHPTAPAPDRLLILQGNQDSGQPLADQAVLRSQSRGGCRGRETWSLVGLPRTFFSPVR